MSGLLLPNSYNFTNHTPYKLKLYLPQIIKGSNKLMVVRKFGKLLTRIILIYLDNINLAYLDVTLLTFEYRQLSTKLFLALKTFIEIWLVGSKLV